METKTLETNKKIARQSFEAFEKKDYSLLEKIADTTKYKLHFPGFEKPLKYAEAVQLNKGYNTAFPDTKVTIENQIAEGDFVLTRVTYQGTNKGELQGIPASGKKAKVTGMSLQRIVNGKIVEEWNEFDALGMMQQVGAIPELETERK
jgi:steroid delta-isomerase-like uncharacterized protein